MKTPSEREIKTFLEKYGTMGKRLGELLETIAPEIGAIKSSGGWAIISDDIEHWKDCAIKVLTGQATEREKQEAVYLSTVRIPSVVNKLTTWYKGIGMIEDNKRNKKGDFMTEVTESSQANAVQPDPAITVASEESAAIAELAKALGKEVPPSETISTPAEPSEPIQKPETTPETTETQPEPSPEPLVIDDDDLPAGADEHKLKSWMGRKLAKQAEEMETRFKGILDGFFASQFKPATPAPDQVELPDIEDLDDIVTTKREVLELVEKAKHAESNQERAYWDNYAKGLGDCARGDKLNPDMIKLVAEELDANMKNPKVHKDPVVSAQLNYNRAVVNVLRRTPVKTEIKIPVSGKEPTSATGIITTQKNKVEPEVQINLDADAKRLKEAFNLSDDFVKKTLKPKK